MLSNSDAALPLHPPGTRPFTTGFSVAEIDTFRQSEARFRALAQATGQIYWVADIEGHLTDSTAWCLFTGQTSEEASRAGWAAAVHPDDQERAVADWATAVATRRPFRHEHRVRRVDGHYRLMLVQAYPVLDADGTVREWVGVDTDITRFQELRAEIQTSQEEFQATFEQAAVGITHVRPDGRILRANQKFCEMLGYSREELLGHSFQELTYPPDLAANLTLLEQLLAGEISTYTLEKRYLRNDGSLVWANLTASLKRDQAGKPQYGIAVIEDISARKATEEALWHLEEELQGRVQELETIFASMHDGLIVFGADGSVLRANPAYAALVDWPADSALHEMSWEERRQTLQIRDSQGEPLPPEQLPLAHILQGKTLAEEHILRSRDGRDVMVSVRGSPLTDAAGHVTGAVLVLHDISERLRLERQSLDLVHQLEAMFEEARSRAQVLQESNRQMDTFLGIVSHELRTPLASMMWCLQSINLRLTDALFDVPAAESSLQALLTSLQEVLTPAELQVVRLERLVKGLLDDARIKEGKLELRLTQADLGSIVQNVVDEQHDLTPDRLIELYTPTDQAILVQGDVDRIKQAVMNYLTNALIYSPQRAPVLVGVEQEAGQARVWVRDHGPGIPLAEQGRVWERFYRVPGITEQNGPAEGLGLGLYITKMLVEGHQGQVGVISSPGQGTTFWFTLPLAHHERCASEAAST